MDARHWGFVSSSGTNGWYTTVSNNEVVNFSRPINSISIEADTVPLNITFNGSNDVLYIDAGESFVIDDMIIYQMVIGNNAGVKIRWRGLVA